ncbi:hypothetical protein UFOVP1522_29 [uncultured Caudovirales phage]|uniref:Uncharacterized protein n=1 Tax=uncultured Caudovirales phage TaxID=2100421 RepID=A0A6J7XBC0_9CAUD|nr:hypothetical protein UFOVP989_58 [uncultured Caudovirales phage]CAB4180959.1 hypothetical protein UFOVP1075_8 [uncultured Caudovirales phage]CAB4198773.1 hypothetical protein UFOVP1312_64 [uncultured Caudovirales phage]CAB4210971.1 hypothetical protein UFOVP1426_58 [uncultured Caudovirales phage]CAB5227344.1 hypothetical protein UFOVP1522_29 [uncultured Caudovirales phage]
MNTEQVYPDRTLSNIEGRLDQLTKEVNNLGETAGNLSNRLTVVLSPNDSPPSVLGIVGGNATQASAPQSETAYKLESLATQVNQITQNLQSITIRLEL